MYFTNKGLQRLKTEIDLVSVIKKEIQLTRLSNGFIGHCPFCDYHNDLFVVTPENNEWYCFGYCQQGGTIIDWYMKRKKINVGQAIFILANEYPHLSNITAKSNLPAKKENQSVTKPPYIEVVFYQQLVSQNLIKQVIQHYTESLLDNEKAMQYMKERGFTMPLLEEFQIGYCNGDMARTLANQHSIDKQVLKKELIEAGFLVMNYSTGVLIERFDGYIIIPEFDNSGDAVKVCGQLIEQRACSGASSLVTANKEVTA